MFASSTIGDGTAITAHAVGHEKSSISGALCIPTRRDRRHHSSDIRGVVERCFALVQNIQVYAQSPTLRLKRFVFLRPHAYAIFSAEQKAITLLVQFGYFQAIPPGSLSRGGLTPIQTDHQRCTVLRRSVLDLFRALPSAILCLLFERVSISQYRPCTIGGSISKGSSTIPSCN